MVYKNLSNLIGGTPLLETSRFIKEENLNIALYTKLEYFNPAGSVKDRAALYMIKSAEEKGLLSEGATIIEATSGNTGIGIASIAASKGYKAIFTMPETMSVERRRLLESYGARIILTDGKKGMRGAIEKADELNESIENSIQMRQFDNISNKEAHKATTGPEIWRDTEGKVDVLIAGVGTGGTISGVGEYLKEQNSSIEVIAVEPEESPVLSGESPGPHGIMGIGAGFVPSILNTEIYDRIIKVKTPRAKEVAKIFAETEGVLVGISSGAALAAAIEVGKNPEYKGKNVVVVLPDTGERYLSVV